MEPEDEVLDDTVADVHGVVTEDDVVDTQKDEDPEEPEINSKKPNGISTWSMFRKSLPHAGSPSRSQKPP